MIANANSIIKVCQVLLMLPFTPLLGEGNVLYHPRK